jgi:glycolate oxidase FAD binding subunit
VEEAAALLRQIGDVSVEIDADDDAARWEAQRAAQRGDVVIKVSTLPTTLPAAMAATEALGGTLVARAGLGVAWIQLPTGPDSGGVVAAIEDLRRRLAPAPCVVLDAPADVRAALDPWGGETGPVELMRKVKERFDPAGICAPGLFVGGI